MEFAPDRTSARFGVVGVIVRSVPRGSAGHRAGLVGARRARRGVVLGDVIIAVEGEAVRDSEDIYHLLDDRKVGDKVTVSTLRDGQQRTVVVTLQAVR